MVGPLLFFLILIKDPPKTKGPRSKVVLRAPTITAPPLLRMLFEVCVGRPRLLGNKAIPNVLHEIDLKNVLNFCFVLRYGSSTVPIFEMFLKKFITFFGSDRKSGLTIWRHD